MDDRDRVQITQDIRRLNMRDKAPPCSRQRDYWERRNLPSSKPRAKSEYSYLDKFTTWDNPSLDQQECHDSGVSLPLAVSQASNLAAEMDNLVDSSFAFLDQDDCRQGIRPHIFNCRSEPSIPPRLNMEPLSQVRPHMAPQRPASIHVSPDYNYKEEPVSSECASVSDESDRYSRQRSHDSTERVIVIPHDPEKGFGFTIRTATNRYTRDRVKIKEVKPESPAALQGLMEGEVLLHVNGQDIQHLTFDQIVDLIHKRGERERSVVKLTVVTPTPSHNEVVHEGFLHKQVRMGGLSWWCKQWVVLKRDSCLYYYKSPQSLDPLGVIVLPSFRFNRAVDQSRKHVIRISRGPSLYLFAAHDEADYEHWIQSLAQAAKNNNVSIQASISNCALAALAINQPALTGWLYKLKLSGFRAKRKYCVLKDNALFFYHNIYDKKAHEVIYLLGYTVAPTSVRSYKYCFALIPPTMKRCNSVLIYADDNKISSERWCDKLSETLQEMKGLDMGMDHPEYVQSSIESLGSLLPSVSKQALHRKDSTDVCEREIYRKKDTQDDTYGFKTLLHGTDGTLKGRPRSWCQ